MLRYQLIHPEILSALGRLGHGSKILITDGNYPHSTGTPAAATKVYLNLAPGLLTVDQILTPLLTAIPIESAQVMFPEDGSEVPAHAGYRDSLGEVPMGGLGRFEFYDTARDPNVGLVIASADQRVFANLLLTVGVRAE